MWTKSKFFHHLGRNMNKKNDLFITLKDVLSEGRDSHSVTYNRDGVQKQSWLVIGSDLLVRLH